MREALTVKLRGRASAFDWSPGCTISYRTRGDNSDCHGTLQRLLERKARSAPRKRSAPTLPTPQRIVGPRARGRQGANKVLDLCDEVIRPISGTKQGWYGRVSSGEVADNKAVGTAEDENPIAIGTFELGLYALLRFERVPPHFAKVESRE